MKKMRLPRKTKKENKKISVRFMPGSLIVRVTGKQNRRTIKLVRRIIHEQRSMLVKSLKAEILNSIKKRFNFLNNRENESK